MVHNIKVKSQSPFYPWPSSHPFSLPGGHHYHHFLSRNILGIYTGTLGILFCTLFSHLICLRDPLCGHVVI